MAGFQLTNTRLLIEHCVYKHCNVDKEESAEAILIVEVEDKIQSFDGHSLCVIRMNDNV